MDLIEVLRTRVQAKLDERKAAQDALDAVLSTPTAEARDLNEAEAASFVEARDRIAQIDADLRSTEERLGTLQANEDARTAAASMASKYPTTPITTTTGGVKVKADARTYTLEKQRREGVSFLRDVVSARFDNDREATERLSRHMGEMRDVHAGIETRAITTASLTTGLVIPQFISDMFAPAVAAMRPTANVMTHHDLPAEGMTLNIPRMTTASSVALQAAENNALSETNLAATLLTINVQTAGGQQTVSRQSIDRGTGTDEIVLGDLIRRYHTTLDSTILNQAATGLDAITTISVAYTDATPTAAELYPKLFDLVQQVQTAVFMGVTHFIMHPRRWAWLASQVGTSWPFLQISGAGVQTAGSYTGPDTYSTDPRKVIIAGTLAGIPVIVDASVTVTAGVGAEDRIYGITSYEAHLWEDPAAPLYLRVDQSTLSASLGVLFVVYGYFAYTFSRYPTAHGKVQGTGLTTPTF